MSKALVIKNANYLANRLAVISFGSIPCTGITFESDTISITGYEPVTITYTVTPANTTDAIVWESSDESVVTVANGVLTVVGIGSATITATCGEYSDTASVAVSVACTPVWYGANVSEAIDRGAMTGGDSSSRIAAFGNGAQATTYVYAPTNSAPARSAIKIPKNTAGIRISITSEGAASYANDTYTKVYWTKDESAGWADFPNAIKYVSVETAYNITRSANYVKTYAVPEGADSMYVVTKLSDTIVAGDDYTSVVDGTGLTIEFLLSVT